MADETIRKVKQAKERERNQKSLAQKRSELLLDEPIVPNIANVESKLKNIMIPKERTEDQTRIDGMRKRSRRTPGKVPANFNCQPIDTIHPICFQYSNYICTLTYNYHILVGQYNGTN